jgi:hypothetical protein
LSLPFYRNGSARNAAHRQIERDAPPGLALQNTAQRDQARILRI